MIKKKKDSSKLFDTAKRYCPIILSPLLTAAAVLYVFRLKGLYPFGSRTASWCDMNQQVVPLLCQFKDILDGKSGMFLSMKNASGMNFWGVFFFFLASPFTLIVKFVEKDMMLRFMDILIVLKMAVCAASASLYFTVSAEHRKLDNTSRTMMGFIYALSGYTMLFYQNIIWLDMMYLFPLMMLSLERMKRRGSPVMYTVMLTLMMIVNYYLGYMLVLFLLLTMGACAIYSLRGGDMPPRFFRSFITGSVTAAMLSAAVWLPCFIQYLSSGRRGELIKNLRKGHFITDYDTVLPVLMCCSTLILLVLADIWRRDAKRTPQHRLTLIMAALTVIPVFIEPINKMWHTGSYMAFPARYAFMTIFMLMKLAAYELETETPFGKSMKKYLAGGIAVAVLMLAYMLSAAGYVEKFGQTLSDYTRALGGTEGSFKGLGKLFVMSLICAAVILFFYRNGWLFKEIAMLFLAGLVILEGVNNTKIYMTYSAERNEATNKVQGQVMDLGGHISDDSFYRIKTTSKIFDYNTIGAMGYNSISHYTSLTSQDYMFTMKRMGYTSVWMEVGSCGGTEITDSLLSIGYRISNSYQKRSFYKDMGYQIAPLDNKLPMGFVSVQHPDAEIPEGLDRASVQRYLAEKIFGNADIVKTYEPKSGNIYRAAGRSTVKVKEKLIYSIPVSGHKTLYFDCFDKLSNSLTEPDYNSFTVKTNGMITTLSYPHSKDNGVLKLGEFCNETVTIEAEALKTIEAASIGVFSVDTDLLTESAAKIEGIGFKEVKNGLRGSYTAPEPQTISLSLPYDSGLTIKSNGKKLNTRRTLSAFTEFDLPAGDNEIEISFRPTGLIAGTAMSAVGAGLLGWLIAWQRIRKKRAVPAERPRTDKLCQVLLAAAGGLVVLMVYIFPTVLNIAFWTEN